MVLNQLQADHLIITYKIELTHSVHTYVRIHVCVHIIIIIIGSKRLECPSFYGQSIIMYNYVISRHNCVLKTLSDLILKHFLRHLMCTT